MTAFILFHVALSLIGVFSGFAVVFGMVAVKPSRGWTQLYVGSLLATSTTGFLFPFQGVTPAFGFGVLTLLTLAIVFFARYARRLAGAWRWIYVLGIVFVLYLNVFVLIVQSFLKVPVLRALAPTQTEPAFVIAQGGSFLLLVALAALAVRNFRPGSRSRHRHRDYATASL